ncbi:alpha-2-macroglobulin family protein [Lignipirellula cremea]|uniref:Alpha-2-macroglobulin family protein n=1 Tax=Lignipirellula cremea TaxID=2528010 RepID=A0A518DSR0_9BACT|nr:alpha-2-macroglobulin family protein [Lignipirellula cremea]QDU94876.1 Alpha-2-macroglobulin family protein [Lignipirellula cremea]
MRAAKPGFLQQDRPAKIALATLGLILFGGIIAGSLGQLSTAADEEQGQAVRQTPVVFGQAGETQPLINVLGPTQPYAAEPRLVLHCDHRQVLGWVAGGTDFAGQPIQVTINGERQAAELILQQGNLFTWPYQATATQTVRFQLNETLAATVQLTPPTPQEPSAFFVVDRTVYRPLQKLKFAAFLRSLDDQGDFQPIPDTAVKVVLTSKQKNTQAAVLELTSDAWGRISGEYLFQSADALDDYTMAIEGYRGQAQVRLAEFRKAKVRLKIDSQIVDRELTLKFQAVDFLENPVPGSQLHFQARILQTDDQTTDLPLDSKQYVYWNGHTSADATADNPDDDRRLLREAGFPVPSTGGSGERVVSVVEADVPLNTSGAGEHRLTLQKSWTEGAYRVAVDGVLVDYNGREQRASRTLSLGGKTRACDLHLSLPKRKFVVGEKFQVEIQPQANGQPVAAKATVVAMKLSPAAEPQPAYGGYGFYNHLQLNYYPLHNYRHHAYGRSPAGRFGAAATGKAAQRDMATAVVATENRAELQLEEAGPYKLVCVARLADGRELQNEIGCLVVEPDDLPAISLDLAESVVTAGGKLVGELHCRHRQAPLLLTLRDSSGVRFCKAFNSGEGAFRFAENLPPGLRYGCVVEAQYVDNQGDLRTAHQFLRVNPTDRLLNIEIQTEQTYEPGATATIGIEVGRQQEVDLVVSVFDQSLLGVSADRAVDIRNFYLADERARTLAAQDRLRRSLGDLKLEALIEKAELAMKSQPVANEGPLDQLRRQAVASYRQNYLHGYQVAALLELAGIPVETDLGLYYYFGHNWHYNVNSDPAVRKGVRVIDALLTVRNTFSLEWSYTGERLHMWETSSNPQFRERFQHQYGNQQLLQYRGYGLGRARGDAHFSVSANAMYSTSDFAASGQSFLSHVPMSGESAPVLDASGVTVRRDFSDLAFWSGTLRTDAQGKASFPVKLPDSLTNWQVVVTAVSRDMHVGQQKASFRTLKPVMVWPMIPRTFTEGDQVKLYASVHNRTETDQEMEVSLTAENGRVPGLATQRVLVPALGNAPVYWTFLPGKAGYTQLLMTARCPAGSDASLKRLPVAPMAAEQTISVSGFARGQAVLHVPDSIDLTQATLEVTLVPSLADDLVQSLDYLVSYPHGCVEQTMSRFLPALRVAQTLQRAGIENAELEAKLPGVVEAGVKRLLQLQQPDGGWGWQAGGATHEMMTPYALYGLLLAEQADYPLYNEQAVLSGVNRLQRFVNELIATTTSEQPNTAAGATADALFCMYVLSHRQAPDASWWTYIEGRLAADQLSDYALAMALEMAARQKQTALAGRLARKLRSRAVRSNGTAQWRTAGFSRWGDDPLEISAAALKSLVAFDSDDPLIPEVLNYFAVQKRGDRWNSTKATAMIIYACCDYLASQDHRPGDPAEIGFQVQQHAAQAVMIEPGKTENFTFAGTVLQPGDNRIRFTGKAPGALFRAVLRYWSRGDAVEPHQHGLNVTRAFYLLDPTGKRVRRLESGDAVPRGSWLQSVVQVQRETPDDLTYLLVENPKLSCGEIVPVEDARFAAAQTTPGGVFREDKTAGVAWHVESTGRTFTSQCVLHAELAGQYALAPAKAELMYETTVRGHSGAFQIRVVEPDADPASR